MLDSRHGQISHYGSETFKTYVPSLELICIRRKAIINPNRLTSTRNTRAIALLQVTASTIIAGHA